MYVLYIVFCVYLFSPSFFNFARSVAYYFRAEKEMTEPRDVQLKSSVPRPHSFLPSPVVVLGARQSNLHE